MTQSLEARVKMNKLLENFDQTSALGEIYKEILGRRISQELTSYYHPRQSNTKKIWI